MSKIQYVCIRFSQNISGQQLPKFRAAIIEKTERKASLFHNHKNDTRVIYRYPLIQYKMTQKKASIVCLNQGTEDIHHLLKHNNLKLRIGKISKIFDIEAIDMHYHQMAIEPFWTDYRLHNWMALNQKHYQQYQQLEGHKANQKKLLESILIGNILSFAKGVGWQIEERIQVQIKKIDQVRPMLFKKRKVLTFSQQFSCNVALPNFVGLGKGSSIGYGVLERVGAHIPN